MKSPKKDEILTFKPSGRILELNEITAEFALMSKALKDPHTPETFRRVSKLSGTHMLKLNTARAESSEAVLRFQNKQKNSRTTYIPSTNARDVPYAKILFRPLEIKGEKPKSLAEHILNPDEQSEAVADAFGKIFGVESLTATTQALLEPLPNVTQLPLAEFPVIFLPNPEGGDIQVSPVAPAAAYMGMREVIEPYFAKQAKDEKRRIRPRLSRQSISAKPQNISGAIGGPRIRFHATMPIVLDNFEASLLSFHHGGIFPRWHDSRVADWVLKYADLLDTEREYTNSNIRTARDKIATFLVQEALAFISEVQEDAAARGLDITLRTPPTPSELIFNRRWNRNSFDRARRALNSETFKRSEMQILERI